MSRVILNNSPIVEAVIDLKFKDETLASIEQIEGFVASIENKFDIKLPINTTSIQIDTQSGDLKRTDGLVGYKLTSNKENEIVQVRLNGITYSKVPPYGTHESFFDNVRKFTQEFKIFSGEVVVERIGVRYINFIEGISFESAHKYLNIVNSNFTGSKSFQLNDAMIRNSFFIKENNSFLTINCGTYTSDSDKRNGVVFDLDSYMHDLNIAIDHKDLWGITDSLKVYLNDYFFQAVTEAFIKKYS